jgi:hypothetical protein
MGKRQKEGMKSGGQGRKSSKRTRTEGGNCQLGRMAYASRRQAEQASPSGRAERCGRCRQWHAVEDRRGRR